MSEKLDGVRGLWDGSNLKSRSGLKFNAPVSWLVCFPPFELDGEIYSEILDFEKITSIVNSTNDKGWGELKYYVFDIPAQKGSLDIRLSKLKSYLDKNPCENIKIIEQIPALSHENVRKFLNKILSNGGEGVVVRDNFAPYISGRSDKILKLKGYLDAECEVVGINVGKGKFKGLLGSVSCKDLKSGKILKIGSGFSDKERKNPPEICEIVTYKYQNLTRDGKPRFPVFLRYKISE